MIDNYLPVFDIEKQKLKQKNITENFNVILNNINDNRHYINNSSGFASIVTSIAHSMLILPSPNSAKRFSVRNSCNDCGTCSKVCPRDNINFNKNIDEHKPIFGNNCEFCLACINLCPKKAIKLKSEKNPDARFMNENVTLKLIINANN